MPENRLMAAAANGAIVYMTWADGQGYKHFGIRGLLLTDGLASLISGTLLLLLLRNHLKRREPATQAEEAEQSPAFTG
jgi:hypothetical protein